MTASRRLRRPNPVWLVLGIVGWLGLVRLAVSMFNQTPRTAAFDLELLLQAGREIAAGRSPYAASMVAGQAPGATDLFYSYPPPIAQAMSLVAGVPSGFMFGVLWAAAIAGLAASAAVVGRELGGEAVGRRYVVPTLALTPMFLPFGIGLLFGNLDVLFPFAYGLVLVGAVSPRPSARIAGGLALAAATIAKIHPGSLGIWFVVRAVRERMTTGRSPSALVVVSAVAAGLVVLAISVLAGGVALWQEYIPVAGAASGARLVDARNVGPAAQVALLVAGDEALVRTLHVPVALAAVAATIAAAGWIRDSMTSLAVGAIASLVVLPVTWYHYPAALIPFAIAAVARAGAGDLARTQRLVLAAGLAATLAIAWLPLLYVAVGLGLAAVITSRPQDAPKSSVAS